jgi:hypothetical protein
MARPTLSPGERRSARVSVSLTEAEREALSEQARDVGLPLAVLVARLALSGQVQAPTIPAANLQAVGELARIGNNLNQLTRLSHQLGVPGDNLVVLLGELSQAVASCRAELRGCAWPAHLATLLARLPLDALPSTEADLLCDLRQLVRDVHAYRRSLETVS